jgi:spore photoproduct lyase
MIQRFDKVYVEEGIIEHPFTRKVLGRLPSVPFEVVDDYKKIGEGKAFPEKVEDKNSLALAEKKGEVLKSIGRMDKDEYYLFHEMDCRYDCEYCYLQYYFQTKVPVIFVNRDKVLMEIEGVLKGRPNPYFHVGEVCDALAFDDLTEFSLDVAGLFSRCENGFIEFRTKSTNIQNLISIKSPPQNVIPSWTLSPESVVMSVEHKTPSFRERLSAAKKCQEAGYTIGIRLDPIIRYEGWEKDYKVMLEGIFSALDSRRIDYVSLGTVKIHKILLDTIKKRFPESPVILNELVPSEGGKYRHLKFQRVDVYRKMISWIRGLNDSLEIKLSMESKEVKSLVFPE